MSSAIFIALSFGGATYAWKSVHVIIPLVLGIVGIALYLWLDNFVPRPTVPYAVLNKRTSLIGYFMNFLVSAAYVMFAYYLPTYFQACKGYGPLKSGVALLPYVTTVRVCNLPQEVSNDLETCRRVR